MRLFLFYTYPGLALMTAAGIVLWLLSPALWAAVIATCLIVSWRWR